MSSPLAGTIPAAGVANAVVFQLTTPDALALLELSGQVAGNSFVFEALPVGSSTWFPLAGLEQDTQGFVTGTAASPFAATAGPLAFKFDVSLCQAVRVWTTAQSGTPVVNWSSGSFFANPPGSTVGAGGLSLQQAILWQLTELTRVAAAGAGITATPNPVLPGGLPATIWSGF